MYKKVSTNLDFVERELEVAQFWKDNKIFEKSMEKTEGCSEFSFFDGPPTANGKPHIGHILTRVMKDIIPRYKTMKGYHVLRKAGWDTHGLPVELEVEKLLGMDGKQDIEKYGIEPFIAKCKESVWKYQSEWEKMTDRVGYWVDMDNPYVTYNDSYIESVWWSISEIFKKDLIYKGHKIVPYCPRCGTSLSSHEVAQGYKDVEEKSAVVAFEVDYSTQGNSTKDSQPLTYILAWTTTPWTLPSNVALCFNPKMDYSLIEANGTRYILAHELIGKYFEEFTVISTKKGKEYEKLQYKPLFDFYNREKPCYYVTCDDYVTLTDGTGIVHIAPAFGEDDAKVGKKYDLPFVQMVDDRGKFVVGTGTLEGVFCKDADKLILRELKERGQLYREIMFSHSYPFCWRCDTPLLYYARSTWFIKMTAVRDKLLANNASVNWLPESIGKGRMGNFLENVIDWGLSRERYWGTPLPIWVCESCGQLHAISSKEELIKLSGHKGTLELHKPYVDAITIPCSACGGTMKRTPEVIDCWYDSGSMPFAQYHYPFENKETFDKTFPADFISEAVDQTRGWFYTLLAISTLLFDKAPFKNCIVLGHVNDKNGIKMSKHKGNVVDPWTVLDKQGSDAVRWYFYTNSSPWLPSRFYDDAVSEAQRKYLGTLWNTYSFYILYAEIDQFNPLNYKLADCKLTIMDEWILSGLNSLISLVEGNLDAYKITESARALQDFTDSLSNWYVRRCRERYWVSEMHDDKIAAYMTLYTVLESLARITAPFTPFMAESIYSNIVCSVDKSAPLSVHLTAFPISDKSRINRELEIGMEQVLKICELGRACRNQSNLKNRQPLSRIFVAGAKPLAKKLLEIIAGELNVREVSLVTSAEEFITYELKPQLKTLGAKYRSLIGKIREHLVANSSEIYNKIKCGTYETEIDGTKIELTEDDVLASTSSKSGFASATDQGITIVLDTVITKELQMEGYMRELVSKIQTMRKENGYEIVDHIRVKYHASATIIEVFNSCNGKIASDVLANEIVFDESLSGENSGICGKSVADNDSNGNACGSKEWDINGELVTISIAKV